MLLATIFAAPCLSRLVYNLAALVSEPTWNEVLRLLTMLRPGISPGLGACCHFAESRVAPVPRYCRHGDTHRLEKQSNDDHHI